jgi:hypothetical protein
VTTGWTTGVQSPAEAKDFSSTLCDQTSSKAHPGPCHGSVVSRRPLTAEARVRARVNPCGICGGQSGNGTGFSPSYLVFPCQYHSTVTLQSHIIWGMRNMLTEVGIHALVLGPPSLLSNGYQGSFPGTKRGQGVMLTSHPHVTPSSRMNRSYTSSPP